MTIPGELVEAADRRASELDRSRSWLLTGALRRYLATVPAPAAREAGVDYHPRPQLSESRLSQLRADLALTPEERVRMAEETALVAEALGRVAQRDRVIGFDRHEDFRAWELRDGLVL
jgi:hypothetical protein